MAGFRWNPLIAAAVTRAAVLRGLEHASDIAAVLEGEVSDVRTVAHQPSDLDRLAPGIDRGQPVMGRQHGELDAAGRGRHIVVRAS